MRIEALLVTSDLRCSSNAAGRPFREDGDALACPATGEAVSRPKACLTNPTAAGFDRFASDGAERATSKAFGPARPPSPARIASRFAGGMKGRVSSKAFGLTRLPPRSGFGGAMGRIRQAGARDWMSASSI